MSSEDVDQASFTGCGNSVISATDSTVTRKYFSGVRVRYKLPLLYHFDMRSHATRLTGSAEMHQEESRRVHLLYMRCFDGGIKKFILPLSSGKAVPCATREQLLRVHSEAYVEFLYGLQARHLVGGDNEVLRFSPLLVSRMFSTEQKRKYFAASKHNSSATRFSGGSLQAALRSSGAVCQAVHMVINDEFLQDRVACLVRPPGHHAGPAGFKPTVGSAGFCLINNVCVGVAEVLQKYPGIKIGIVDFDVHHGNGTQDIMDEVFKGKDVIFCSVHLNENFPDDHDLDFFPGTGGYRNDEQVLSVPIDPLWLSDNDRSGSSNDGTCSKKRSVPYTLSLQGPPARKSRKNQSTDTPLVGSVHSGSDSVVDDIDPTGLDTDGTAYPKPLKGRQGFREAMEKQVLPKLRAFGVDILFISAGFDGSLDDEGCVIENVSGLDLNESDYYWMTELLVKNSGASKVISVLEGGYGRWDSSSEMYDLSALSNNYLAHLGALLEKNS